MNRSVVLIVENDPVLRELNELILTDAGYEVALVPLHADPVELAARDNPDVIVIKIGPIDPRSWDIIDRLEAGAGTKTIPVVVISSAERTAVEARLAPNVSATIVAPYDIDALSAAVRAALGNPPVAALLPEPHRLAPPAVAFAAGMLMANGRTIILTILRQTQTIEPYASRFAELSAGLINNVPRIYAALTTALHRGLTPEQVVATPEVRQVISEHVRLRESQGLRPAPVVVEYQILRQTILQFLRGRIDQTNLTAADAFDLAMTINALVDAIIGMAIEDFQASSA